MIMWVKIFGEVCECFVSQSYYICYPETSTFTEVCHKHCPECIVFSFVIYKYKN